MILFKPKSEKVRVWVWRESDKREVDAFLGLIYEGYEIERERKGVWLKERRSHHWRWLLR